MAVWEGSRNRRREGARREGICVGEEPRAVSVAGRPRHPALVREAYGYPVPAGLPGGARTAHGTAPSQDESRRVRPPVRHEEDYPYMFDIDVQ